MPWHAQLLVAKKVTKLACLASVHKAGLFKLRPTIHVRMVVSNADS